MSRYEFDDDGWGDGINRNPRRRHDPNLLAVFMFGAGALLGLLVW